MTNIGEYILYDDSDISSYISLDSTQGYAVQSTNFESMPTKLLDTSKCPGNSDSFYFDSGYDAKVVNITIKVLALSLSDMKDKLHTLKKFLLKDWIRIYSKTSEKYIRVKYSGSDIPEDVAYRGRLITISLDFIAPMPFLLDNNLQSYIEDDISSSLYSINIYNSGDMEVYPLFTITNSSTGDIVGFNFTNLSNDTNLQFTGTIEPLSILTIDNSTRSIDIDGQDAIEYLEGNGWIMLSEGSNNITITSSTSGEEYIFNYQFRPRYI